MVRKARKSYSDVIRYGEDSTLEICVHAVEALALDQKRALVLDTISAAVKNFNLTAGTP